MFFRHQHEGYRVYESLPSLLTPMAKLKRRNHTFGLIVQRDLSNIKIDMRGVHGVHSVHGVRGVHGMGSKT